VFDGVETYKFTEEGRFFQPFVDFKKGVVLCASVVKDNYN
jgi:hypothetical protein